MSNKKSEIYHSSLKSIQPLTIENALESFAAEGCNVLKHDVCSSHGLPKVYERCDVLYSEPAWRAGYQTFQDRAEAKPTTYLDYVQAINRIVKSTTAPLWLIIGSHIIRKIVEPHRKLKVSIHGYDTNLLGWNDEEDYGSFETNYDFVRLLAQKYDCVGDFCCGYGNTGRLFQEAGKKFVLSDLNGKCVYYVAKELLDYNGPGNNPANSEKVESKMQKSR